MALDALNSLNLAMRAPASTPAPMPKTLNPTNHMPQTEGGAFILPSVARISRLPQPHIRTCDNPRLTAMKYGLGHCDRTSPAPRTNRLCDCGTRAERSTTARMPDGRPDCMSGDRRPSIERVSPRSKNNVARCQFD